MTWQKYWYYGIIFRNITLAWQIFQLALSPWDTGLSHSRETECRCRHPFKESSCPDSVSSWPISVSGCCSTFSSVASDWSAGDSPELPAAGVNQSFSRSGSVQHRCYLSPIQLVQDGICLPAHSIGVQCADEAPGPGLDSDHDSPMVNHQSIMELIYCITLFLSDQLCLVPLGWWFDGRVHTWLPSGLGLHV